MKGLSKHEAKLSALTGLLSFLHLQDLQLVDRKALEKEAPWFAHCMLGSSPGLVEGPMGEAILPRMEAHLGGLRGLEAGGLQLCVRPNLGQPQQLLRSTA